MTITMKYVALLFAFSSLSAFAADVTLEQVISRESPLFRCQLARMAVGRDGFVYLTDDKGGKGFCLRLSRDGKQKLGGEVIYAIHNATANAAGVIATANAHFNHSLNFYDSKFQKLVATDDFLVNDQVGWDAPSHVEAGASGDFYGIDQHRNRVLRVGADGKVKAVHPIRAAHEADWGKPNDFRVCEALQALYWLANGHLVRTNLDGSTAWKVPVTVQYRWDVGSYGGWDVDDAGNIWLIEGVGQEVKRLDPDGKPLPPIPLEFGDLKPTPAAPVTCLRVTGKDIVVRRQSMTELFQVYDQAGGKRKHVESIDHESLTVRFPSLVWTNGEQIPVSIHFRSGATEGGPQFRIWITPFGLSEWLELPRDNDSKIKVPDDFAGLFQIKVSPEVVPRQASESSEYLVREIVEVRRPNSQGTAAVVTPLNRVHYAVSESLRGRIVVRTQKAVADNVDVHLRDRKSGQVVASQKVMLSKTKDVANELGGSFQFETKSGSVANPGDYQLDVEIAELTCVPQRIVIGHGQQADFRRIVYGDYGLTSPQGNAWESADFAAAHSDRMQKLGINQFVNRTHQLSLDFPNDDNGRGLLNRVKQRLQADPLAVSPEKTEFGSPHHAIAALYSANGWREFLMLVYMDGGLPMGTGFDKRTPAQFGESIQRFTESLWSYPGFAGWAWVANWWIFDLNSKFKSPDEQKSYEAALKLATQSGKWDPILDRVDDRKYGYAVDAQGEFKKALDDASKKIAKKNGMEPRQFVTSSAGPYRRPEVLPEVNFSNVDEIDIHYQAEQITTPDWVPHAVDVSRHLGQRAWIHPELWNDFGTGEQILPMSWLAIARGADGIGTSGNIPNWVDVKMDSRLGFHGTTTLFRTLNRATDELAEPLRWARAQAQPDNDRIGIVVSARQQKIETFGHGVGSPTFSRQFEAYQSFLTANCPARFVSLAEVKTRFLRGPAKPDLRKSFDALLLVGQTVELEPEWQSFLKDAKSAGVRILADGTCRKDISDAEPLGLSFDVIEKEHSVNSDYAFYVYPQRIRANAQALAPIVDNLKSKSRRPSDLAYLLDAKVEADKSALQPIVILQQYRAKPEGGIVFVVNNTPTTLPPGQLRKLGRASATRAPVVARVQFRVAPNERVMDLLSGKESPGSVVTVDLRDSYARVYWIGHINSSPFEAKNRPEKPASIAFGPHLRDVAVSTDGTTALLNAFNWDHNLYAVNLDTGKVTLRKRIGDHFAYAPQATSTGFVVQGYDLDSAEGYHLYALDQKGQASRRFALPGVPGCLTGWAFTAWIQDRVNNFAAPATGNWVAACGNLGLAVWDRNGKALWSEDWSQTERKTSLLQPLGQETLVTATGMTITARQAATGKEQWKQTLANSGEIIGLSATPNGSTLAVRTTNAGGRVFVLKEGQVVGHFATPADGLSMADDGGVIAVTTGHQLKVYLRDKDQKYSAALAWLAQGDDQLRFPCVSPDGQRIAVCSELGTLSVFASDGWLLHQRDEASIVVPAWLADGDLLIEGWTGFVARIGANFQDRWRTHVRDGEVLPSETTITTGDRLPDPPTTRVTSWAVAQTAIPSQKNLLQPNQFIARWLMGDQASTPTRQINDLVDGKFVLPPESPNNEPWLSWYDHGMIESGWRGEFSLVVDSFNKQFRIDTITFVEDAAHPESWMRDMRCEYWDADAERWVFAQYLTSDSAVHSHKLKKPIEAARIRFTKSDGHAWPAGNVRLQELILHGETLGASHPDVVAKRPVAVLFDENVASVKSTYEHGHNAGLKFATGPDAFSGGNYITMPANKNYGALWLPPFGHTTPNWWFDVVEKPEAGQYRYLQFSVKALAPETKGITLRVAPAHYGGLACTWANRPRQKAPSSTRNPLRSRCNGTRSPSTCGSICPKTRKANPSTSVQ